MAKGRRIMVRGSRFFEWRRALYRLAREHRHLWETYLCLTRADRSKKNPRHLERFHMNFPAFVEWSRENGFSLESELALVNPTILEDTRKIVKWTKEWGKDRQGNTKLLMVQEGGLYFNASENFPDTTPDHWITDYDPRWIPIDRLASMRPRPLLTAYGKKRVRAYKRCLKRRPKVAVTGRGSKVLIEAFGERKSASAWSRDPRAGVSDKVIKRRIASGAPPEEAITAPPDQAGRPRKG